MNSIEDQYQKIMELYPDAIIEENYIYKVKIPLRDKFFLKINYKNYPKKPIVSLISKDGRIYRKVDKIIPLLNRWQKKNPPFLVDLISEILTFIKSMEINEVKIKKE